MTKMTLKEQIAAPEIVVAPGIYDAFSGAMAESVGFCATYLSGASIAYTKLGRPDVGLVSFSEVAEILSNIRERIDIPIIVDADTGFGNALNVQRTVRLFERYGVNAIQLEDQSLPKRCGHLAGKTLVSASEAVGKLNAALDARISDELLIIARTDAIAVEGLNRALDRAERYVEAGVDMLFVEAPQNSQQIKIILDRFAGRVPLMANMVEGGSTPMCSTPELQQQGYSLAIFPGGLVRARAKMERDYFLSLKQHGWNQPFKDKMLDLTGLNDLLGTQTILETGGRYDGKKFEDDND
jgi:2-methylisocitrate lyase-like PEP mutase family enzyme|tara:strand:- start:14572 stop:15462 length:891 start_codon:yes stop_codon:yes gene_type:complete